MFYAATVHRETFRLLAQFLVDRIFVSPDSDRNETPTKITILTLSTHGRDSLLSVHFQRVCFLVVCNSALRFRVGNSRS